jgi:hypothetical protein
VKAACLLVAALLGGCGSNRPEIPPELLENDGSGEAREYPEGPYGSEPGELAANAEFVGFRRPLAATLEASALEELSLDRFYDPDGYRYELILLNSAALWCSVCIEEHRSLPAQYAEFQQRGLVVLSALFQDQRGDPADFDDLRAWIQTFDVPFPMVLDPDYQLGVYASAETAPLNLLIDARTMRILEKFVGDQREPLWSLVGGELSRREADE